MSLKSDQLELGFSIFYNTLTVLQKLVLNILKEISNANEIHVFIFHLFLHKFQPNLA